MQKQRSLVKAGVVAMRYAYLREWQSVGREYTVNKRASNNNGNTTAAVYTRGNVGGVRPFASGNAREREITMQKG